MATEARSATECPPASDLERLIRNRLTTARTASVVEHLGACDACQKKMDDIAGGDAMPMTQALREVEIERPPQDSAYWKALSASEAEVAATALFPTPNPAGNLKLDFLKKSEAPEGLGRLGGFEIVRVVGRGGMGVVLHGYDPDLQRDVAVKVLDPQLADNELARHRFCREARAAAAVTNENLVAVHQVNEDETSGLPYLVMQLIVGESLEQRIKRVGKLTPMEVAKIGMQAAAGLAAAHATGLIHRDIKPGNILLEEPGDRVKLTDFGLARAHEDVKLTRSGFVAGTPLYMAPEQARADEVDHRADLFSLGSVLYESATGKPPFDGKSALAVLRRVTDETPPPLDEVLPDFPAWLSDAVDRLLAKQPEERFQTAAEVADLFAAELALAHALNPLDVPSDVCGARSTTRVRRRKHVCWKSVAFRTLPWVGGAVLGGLLVGMWSSPREQTPPPAAAANGSDVGPPPKAVLNPPRTTGGVVWALAFTPDLQTLASGSEDGSILVWDLKEQNVRRTLPRLDGNVWSLDVSADGRFLVATSDDSTVSVIDLNTYRPVFSLPHPTSTKAAVFSPDGKFVATGDRNATVRVWSMDTTIPTEFKGHRGTVHSLAYSPDGLSLASAGSDGTVKVWDTQTGTARFSLELHTGPVYGVAFSPDLDKPRIATAGWDGTVRVWHGGNGDLLHTIKMEERDVWSVAFGHGGKVVAAAGAEGVRVWNAETAAPVATYKSGSRVVHTVRFAKDGTTLAVGGRDGAVRLWDVPK
jgi:serine/threonine protein kinase/DNA-binding beta-propeller fold protein YncE